VVAFSSGATQDGQDVVGQTMPPLAFDGWINTDGNRPPDTAGKVTLYRWWTDGCPHCEKSLPAVEALRKKYPGLRVVAVYHPKPPRDVSSAAVRGAAATMGYAGPIAIDRDWSELRKFYLDKAERRATSASFVVDQKGVIRFVHPGPRFFPSEDPADARENEDFRRVEQAVKGLLESES
jgi:thiol-disulfide isomerase/thioredoxin